MDDLFPIPSQTTPADKVFLLASIALVKQRTNGFSYLEIGSYLGGSLVPFLRDTSCKLVVSVDERERTLEDERNAQYSYLGISQQTMIDKLHACGVPTDKLIAHDGSIETFVNTTNTLFDIAFIDGEHTDIACFRDFLWSFPMMRPDSVVLFHDRTLIHKALRMIGLYLRKSGVRFLMFYKAGSEMAGLCFGSYIASDLQDHYGPEEAPNEFYGRAEMALIRSLLTNRIRVDNTLTVLPAPVVPPH